jgi:MOSC domain-containing protein YiiM
MAMPTIVSIQVGRAQAYELPSAQDGKLHRWRTAFVKTASAGPVQVAALGLAGDEQADRQNHGGLDKAVLAYAASHYGYWEGVFRGMDISPAGPGWSNTAYGAFGENLTIEGLDEAAVAIGDRWQAGDVVLEVSQPRQPCWKMGRRWGIVDLPKRVIQNGKSGWYLRVVKEGVLTAGSELTLLERPHAEWTVARVNRLFFHEAHDTTALEALANLPELSAAWRESIYERLASRS